MQHNIDDNLFTLSLAGGVGRQTGQVRLVARNTEGEVTVEARLTLCRNAPIFVQQPYISQVLEG